MSTIQLQLHRRLAQTVALTTRLRSRTRPTGPLALAARAIDFLARGAFYAWRNRRYLTAIKLANMALVNVQFALKTERVMGRPYKAKIEPTNVCNTRCQLCPTGLGLRGRERGRLDMDRFRRLVDSMKWHLFVLDLSMWGDRLIVPEIFDMIRYAHDRGIWTYTSSNLHAFKPEHGHAEKLVRSGLDLLTCSLHGASQETYVAYQPGKRFGDAVDRVRHLIQTRDRLGSPTPAVQLNFVVTRFNEHEQAAFKTVAEELGCKPVFSWPALNTRFLGHDKSLTSLGLADDVLREKTRSHLERWLPRDRAFVLEPYRRMLADGAPTATPTPAPGATGDFNGRKLFDCSWPWRSTVINWDGAVSPCCGSFDPREDLGNVFEQPFGRIWNGPRYRASRRSFRHRVAAEDARDNACASCPGYLL